MTNKHKIVLLGSGNVAFHLAEMLKINDINLCQVYNINEKSGKELAKKYNTLFTNDTNNIIMDADLYIISIKDNFIEEFIEKLNISNAVVVHTSGTTDINVFANKFTNYGILYPLQTFSKNINIEYKEVPLLIEANNIKTLNFIGEIANNISNNVINSSSEQRRVIHIAAVFACNFTNYLFSIADNLLEKQNLSFDLLKPLIKETTRKAIENKPQENQTGPAKRKDINIINKHLKCLEKNKEIHKLYELISEMIINYQLTINN